MKIRYCETELHQQYPCSVGWGESNNPPIPGRSCMDEPKEKNCKNLVDPFQIECPACGRKLYRKFREYMKERLFFDRLREAIKTFNDLFYSLIFNRSDLTSKLFLFGLKGFCWRFIWRFKEFFWKKLIGQYCQLLPHFLFNLSCFLLNLFLMFRFRVLKNFDE